VATYGRFWVATEDLDEDPPSVTVHRVGCLPFARSKFLRSFSYLSFLLGCLWRGPWIRKPDLIVTMTTPPLLTVVGGILQKLRSTEHFIWAMDLFPEALVDVGLLPPNSTILALLNWVSQWVYSRANGIVALGECMRERLLQRNVAARKIHVVENWADGRNIFPIQRRANEALVVLYSGNFGLTHDIETIQTSLEALGEDPRFHFRFVGDGVRYRQLQEYQRKRQLRNLAFFPYCATDEMAVSLSRGDIGLVMQSSTCIGSVVPSKVYGLMAAGKPILYVGPRGATPHRIIEHHQCGWQVDCGDGQALTDLLGRLEANRELVASAGARARAAFIAHYDLPQGVSRFCHIIGAVSRARTAAQVA
jgi:colanic acid biosynthesis glycosyl transferase WcaI